MDDRLCPVDGPEECWFPIEAFPLCLSVGDQESYIQIKAPDGTVSGRNLRPVWIHETGV